MSGHRACVCKNKDGMRRVRERYKSNRSYFETPKGGYHASDYSTVVCMKCGAMYRTKAKCIDDYPFVSFENWWESLPNHK